MSVTTDKKHILEVQPYSLTEAEKSELFNPALIDELKHHYDNNDLYRRFCIKKAFDPHTFEGELSDIPYIPVHIFKTLGGRLSSVSKEKIKTKLQSSATSGVPSTVLLDKITLRRQTKAMARVMMEVLGNQRRPFYVMDIDPTSPHADKIGARFAAITGYLMFASKASYFVDSGEDGKLHFMKDEFIDNISLESSDKPVVIFGFTFVLYQTVFKPLIESGVTFSLPAGSKVIHIGGWKKLEAEKVKKSQFNTDIAKVLGIEPSAVVDIYGFTEQMGLNYPDCPEGWKHLPAYSELLVRDEATLAPCADGNPGLLEFMSPLPHSYPGNVVLTDDLGVAESAPCKCGRRGRRFQLIGRAKKAEVRGCGDVMSDKVAHISAKGNQPSEQPELMVYHCPKPVGGKDPIADLNQIIDDLEAAQKWLVDQPLEALIGLINRARLTWANVPELAPYQSHGLNFLISWCDPSNLRQLLDAALHGKRAHLDTFQLRPHMATSSVRAVPRGMVCHWLSGNVPLLGMFALLQSVLTKNVNLLKVSADEDQALPCLLNSFKGLEYVTPGGYVIRGDDLLKTIGVVYFSRQQLALAEKFSSCANVRIAWGGRDAVEAVGQLPRQYSCQDIFFGPKLSMMVIAKEALDTDKAVKRLLRRAATDASVFNQFACASPHTIFIEKGGLISPRDFAERLASAMDKALVRLPTGIPDIGQANQIRSKIAEYRFIGEVWSDEALRWTVLFEEDQEIAPPTYHRVITVKAVDDVFSIVDKVNPDIQTIGLAMKGKRKLTFANQVTLSGAERCPDIGQMTHFDSPWDGLYAIDRMVRWVSLGGPAK